MQIINNRTYNYFLLFLMTTYIIDSKRSEHNFTMMLLIVFTSRVIFDGKMNISDFKIKKFPIVFIKIGKNHKKVMETGIFTQNQFLTKSVSYKLLKSQKSFVVIFLKSVLSSNFYKIVKIYKYLILLLKIHKNFVKKINTKFLIRFPSNSYKKTRIVLIEKNLMRVCNSRNDNDLFSNDFQYLLLFKKSHRYLKFSPVIITQTTFFTDQLKIYPRLTNHLRLESDKPNSISEIHSIPTVQQTVDRYPLYHPLFYLLS
ncbi:hypothetical protein AGLY_013034 [Aphis glycines]|uniref:Uncharacterized protein n=1 Tax=Aphis glycines TaxID=307491 RepID=A0A6G0T8F5_APHGL|nr:hypothetical protein AGLY_013034 [Aphis glycines]